MRLGEDGQRALDDLHAVSADHKQPSRTADLPTERAPMRTMQLPSPSRIVRSSCARTSDSHGSSVGKHGSAATASRDPGDASDDEGR